MSKVLIFLNLPRAQKFFLWSAWWQLFIVQPVVWILPFKSWQALLLKSEQPTKRVRSELSLEKISWLVMVASSFVPRSSCLTRAIVTKRLAERHGYLLDISLGVKRMDKGLFAAHAWIEHKGEVLIGQQVKLDSYSKLYI